MTSFIFFISFVFLCISGTRAIPNRPIAEDDSPPHALSTRLPPLKSIPQISSDQIERDLNKHRWPPGEALLSNFDEDLPLGPTVDQAEYSIRTAAKAIRAVPPGKTKPTTPAVEPTTCETIETTTCEPEEPTETTCETPSTESSTPSTSATTASTTNTQPSTTESPTVPTTASTSDSEPSTHSSTPIGPTTTAEPHNHSSTTWIYVIIGIVIIVVVCVLLLVIGPLVVMWLKKRNKANTTQNPTKPKPDDADIESFPVGGGEFVQKPEWRPHHIPPDGFKFKGPVQLHNAMTGSRKHAQDGLKSQSIKGNIEWDDNANEAYEIGENVETIQDVAPEELESTMMSKSEQIEQEEMDQFPGFGLAPEKPSIEGPTPVRSGKSKSKKLKGHKTSKGKKGSKERVKKSHGPRRKSSTTYLQ